MTFCPPRRHLRVPTAGTVKLTKGIGERQPPSLASRIVRATPKPFAPAATLQQFAEVMCGFSRAMQHGRVLSVVQDRRHGYYLYEAYDVVVYVGAYPPGPL